MPVAADGARGALGEAAAAALRQAASMALRRGHPQVTPLHVACAIVMSSSSSSSSSSAPAGTAELLLRAACPLRLQIHLDAALGRLPLAAAASLTTTVPPPLSNALKAALKRAQAAARCRRSGNGKLPVELEQLAASILNDPNVHRAVRDVVKRQKQKHKTGPSIMGQDHQSLALLKLSFHHSSSRPDQSSQAKQRTVQSAIAGGTEVVTAATASLPPWLCRINQDQYRPNLTTYASCYRPKFRELTAKNLKIMCDALEVHVPPRHRGIVPGVASTVLRCRSGMMRRRQRPPASTMTWLLFRGKDRRGKKAMALELARLVFGSYTEFTSSDSDPGLKIMSTGRHAHYDAAYAMLENPHRVVFINGIDDLDHEFMGATIMNGIVTRRLMECNGSNGGLEEAIIVLSSDEVASSSSPRAKRQRISSGGQRNGEESPRHFRLNLNTPAEDQEYVVEEEEHEEYLVDKDAGIMGIVDGVFRFN